MAERWYEDPRRIAAVVADEPDRFLAEHAARRFRAYVEQAWPVVEPDTPLIPGWHLDAVCAHLQAVADGELRDLVITIPPGFAKSTLVSVLYPTWRWVRAPQHRFLTTAHDGDLAVRDAVRSRRVITSDWYQGNWGDRYQLTGDQNVKGRYENDRTGYRVARGLLAGLTGERADTVICDDPHNVKQATSDVVREETLRVWAETMNTRLNDPKTGARIVIQQRVHERDLAGVLIEAGYEHLALPMEYEPTTHVTGIGWSDPRTEPGELLHPERYGEPEVAKLRRDLGSRAYAAQYQQRPSPAAGGILKRAWLTDHLYEPADLPPPSAWDDCLQSWDMTFRETQDGSYVVGQVWARAGATCYLLDQVRERVDFPGALALVRRVTADWPAARAKLVEDKANGPAVVATLRDEVGGLVEVTPAGGKVARANAVSALIEAGNVRLPRGAPWTDGFVEEAAAFPHGAHDDQVDAMTQALLRLHPGHGWDGLADAWRRALGR